jgi:hypothetical protein
MTWKRWQDWGNVVLGIWLFFGPWGWMTKFDTASSWNAWIVGIAIVVVALWALSLPNSRFAEWFNVILGFWLFLAPWTLHFSWITGPAQNAWIVGALVAILSLWAITAQRHDVGKMSPT